MLCNNDNKMNQGNRYDIENKSNRFMEFVSRQMMRRNKNKSYAQQPKSKNSKLFNETSKEGTHINNNISAIDIYSQSQLPRYRRGASLLRSNSKSKHNNDSHSKFKKQMRDTSLNFYEGLKNKQFKTKSKQDTSPAVGGGSEQNFQIEQLHYEMVKMHHHVRKLQQLT